MPGRSRPDREVSACPRRRPGLKLLAQSCGNLNVGRSAGVAAPPSSARAASRTCPATVTWVKVVVMSTSWLIAVGSTGVVVAGHPHAVVASQPHRGQRLDDRRQPAAASASELVGIEESIGGHRGPAPDGCWQPEAMVELIIEVLW